MKKIYEMIKAKLNIRFVRRSNRPYTEKFEITEHESSNWCYHISRKENLNISLCGKRVMNSSQSLSKWGIAVKHVPEKYCKECSEIFIRIVGDYFA
ncbi:MAG: hypothetical protein GY870_22440 [archaeon]|nr:hypothetical protein [archaeon]